MDDSPVEEYRDKMTDWGLPLSQYSQQCQACFAPQSGSGLDIVENTEQGRQANQYRYPRPERRYSVFRNQGTVAPEYSADTEHPAMPPLGTYETIAGKVETIDPAYRKIAISTGNTKVPICFDDLEEVSGEGIVGIDEFLGISDSDCLD